MVRETRHLWVGNLPENIREDRIREHFKRYGRVQSVKLLPRVKDDEGQCATVAFMDIKSASKAHNTEHKLDERCLSTEYYEPAAIPGSRFTHGLSEDFDRSSHFYDRRDYRYHVAEPVRGRTRERLYRNGPYAPLLDRSQATHHRPLGNAWSYDGASSTRYPPSATSSDPYSEDRRDSQPSSHKKRQKSSRSGSESGSNSGSSRSRSRSRSRSHSSSSSSHSGSSSGSSATSSPGTDKSCSPHSSHHGTVRSGRMGGVALQSTVSTPHVNNVSPAIHSEDRRPIAICVRNLPVRSSDSSLKDGLFHEYKKHGKVTSVKVVGQAGDRYAIVCFKKADDAEKALEVSHDKLFFGCKIEVAPYQGYDVDDNEFRPYEAEQDEYHPKATRTLFIGNLEKDVTASELRKHFEKFGEIIEIDIKKQGVQSSYAFCQFSDISSVVKAMRTMDGEHLGNNRIKLGFGKSMPTNCVWVDGISENVSEKYLNMHFHNFGAIDNVIVDRDRGHALIYFEQVQCAQEAVRELRGTMLRGRKLQVDFASRECQEAFYEHLQKQGHGVAGEKPWERYDTSRDVQSGRFEATGIVPAARFNRYDTTTTTTSSSSSSARSRGTSYNRSANNSNAVNTNTTPNTGTCSGRTSSRSQRGQRNYDEFSQGSGASHDDSYEQELRDYGYSQRERSDSSPTSVTCESDSMRRSVAVLSRSIRSDKSTSPCEKPEEDFKRHSLQSVVVSDVSISSTPTPQVSATLPPPSQHPTDIRHLQKERTHIQHLLDQLEGTSSADEDSSTAPVIPKKRSKLTVEECNESVVCSNSTDNCYDTVNHSESSGTSLLVTTHNHRKSVSEIRRMSDSSTKHCNRRLSTDSISKHSGGRDIRETSADRLVSVQVYSPHPVCKRRKTGSSASESEERASCRSGKHSHHHHHHHNDISGSVITVSGGESVDGSRPGTPLCDERPENLLPPSEPRRIPRDRGTSDGPLSLPLPRFAAQVLSSPRVTMSISGSNSKPPPSTVVSSPQLTVSSPRILPSHPPPPSPGSAPPPASPPPRPPSLPSSSSSSDSEISPSSPTLEERIRSLNEKYEKWSGSRAVSAAGGDVLAKLDASASEKFRIRHKLLDLNELQPSDIVKSVLAKRSVFDEDSKRLENFSDKYEPREFVPYTRTPTSFQSLRIKTDCLTQCSTPTKSITTSPVCAHPLTGVVSKLSIFPNTSTSQSSRVLSSASPLSSPSQSIPKSPFSTGTGTVLTFPNKSSGTTVPIQCSKVQTIPKTTTTSNVSPRSTGTNLPAAKGLQYPFPSHPPVLPTTTVATTTATSSAGLVPVSSVGIKPSLCVTVPTTATGTVSCSEVSRTCVKPNSTVTTITCCIARTLSSLPVLTSVTSSRTSPEISTRAPVKVVSSVPTSILSPSANTSSEAARIPTYTSKASDTVVSTSRTLVTANTSNTGTKRVSCPAVTVPKSPSRAPIVTSLPSATYCVSSTVATTKITQPVTTLISNASNDASIVSQYSKVQKTPDTISKVPTSGPLKLESTQHSNSITTVKTPANTEHGKTEPNTSNIPPIITTVAAAYTVTTTVVTMTLASVAVASVTSTMVSATAVSPIEIGKQKSKVCSISRKDTVQPNAKDKLSESSLQGKSVSQIKTSPTKREVDSSKCVSNHKSKSLTDERKDKKDKSGCQKKDERDIDNIEKRRDRVDSSDDRKKESLEVIDRKRDIDQLERDRRKDQGFTEADKERKRDGFHDICDRDRKRDNMEMEKTKVKDDDKRRENEIIERDKWKESISAETDREKWKEREDNLELDRRKDMYVDGQQKDEEKERRKERRKDRMSTSSSPASIGCKRRMSSQDSLDSVPDDAKRLKLSLGPGIDHRKVPERRDSKDSGRSTGSSSKRSSTERSKHGDKGFSKILEEKIRDDRKSKDEPEKKREKDVKSQDGFERHKIKDKQKKKIKTDRESPKDQRESTPGKPIKDVCEKDFSPKTNKKKDDSESDDKDDKHKCNKKEGKEKKKLAKDDVGSSECLEEKAKPCKKDKEKRSSIERRKDEAKEELKIQKKPHKKDLCHSDTESEDGTCDGPKKHSIFDIVDDSPAYISMYDKVKARSTKNMQKLEEEKRQEKMREKFNLLKQSRAKREEKKRSTSWDEDSDSDNPDRNSKTNKRMSKLMISSSSEDDGRIRSSFEGDDIKVSKSRQIIRMKKEGLLGEKSDSDSDVQNKLSSTKMDIKQEDTEDEGTSKIKHILSVRKGSRSKLVSDTSEDDMTSSKFKVNTHKTSEMYSIDSDVDLGYGDSDDKAAFLKKLSVKNSKLIKVSDSQADDSRKCLDVSKLPLEKQSIFKKTVMKNKSLKTSLDSSDDDTVNKVPSMPLKFDVLGEDKQAIFRKSIAKSSKLTKLNLDSSDDEHIRKVIDGVKVDEKHLNFKKHIKTKTKSSLDSSDEDSKLHSDTYKQGNLMEESQSVFQKVFVKNKSKSSQDIQEENLKKFQQVSDKEGFGGHIENSKNLMTGNDLENISDAEVNCSSPPQLEKVLMYDSSTPKTNDVNRKKSHKKKQKRQKILSNVGNEDILNKFDIDIISFEKQQTDNCILAEDKIKSESDRKRHKRERRKSYHGKDTDSKTNKSRKKKTVKPELGVLKAEISLKREEKMEDIFGPLSDDSEPGQVKSSPLPHDNGGRSIENLPSKWKVSVVYASDSDSNIDQPIVNSRIECYIPSDVPRLSEKERRKKEKKRRDKKLREENVTADIAEAGKALEAKLLNNEDHNDGSASKLHSVKNDLLVVKQDISANDTDVFRFTDGDESLDAVAPILVEKIIKEKKKKRKKSKEEKQNRRDHHHHHHHHHDKSKSSPERRASMSALPDDVKLVLQASPSLPTLDTPLSPVGNKTIPLSPESPHGQIQPCREPVLNSSSKLTACLQKNNEKKKPEKFIPGFGSAIDDNIHETAVKSISEFEPSKPDPLLISKSEETTKANDSLKVENDDNAGEEEKPRAVISQEETEDAVAALLGESFGDGFGDVYEGETPASPSTTTNANQTETHLTTDEEETRQAVEGLIDMKPETPQSEPDLQIDTDTEDNAEDSFNDIKFNDSTSRPQGFSEPAKSPKLTGECYSQQINASKIFDEHALPKTTPGDNTLPSAKVDEPSPPSIQPPTIPSPESSVLDVLPKETSSGKESAVLSIPEEIVKIDHSGKSKDNTPEIKDNIVCSSEINVEDSKIPVGINIKEEPVSFEEDQKTITPPSSPNYKDSEIKFSENVKIEKLDIEDNSKMCTVPKEENKPLDNCKELLAPKASEPKPTTEPKVCLQNQEHSELCPQLPTPPEEVTESDKIKLEELCIKSEFENLSVIVKEEISDESSDNLVKTEKFEQSCFPTSEQNDVSAAVSRPEELSKDNKLSVAHQEDKQKQSIMSNTTSTLEKPFDSVANEEPLNDTRESEFSEPETDMKSDNDFVTNLLASESMTKGLSEDSRPPFVSDTESSADSKTPSVIKEFSSHRFHDEKELFSSQKSNNISTSILNDSFGPRSNGKEDFRSQGDLASAIKADSEYWAAKEVNLDSVIKKVDALCSADDIVPGEEVESSSNILSDKQSSSPRQDVITEIKQSVIIPNVEDHSKVTAIVNNIETSIKSEPNDALEEVKSTTGEISEAGKEQSESVSTPDIDTKHHIVDSPEDEHVSKLVNCLSTEEETTPEKTHDSECSVPTMTTPKSSRRGRRGTSGKRKTTVRSASGVTTRRTRLSNNQKLTVEMITVPAVSPRRGGRSVRGARVSPHETLANVKKLSTDVYEFHDDSEDEGSNTASSDKGRPRLILTIKSPVCSAANSSVTSKDSGKALCSPVTSPVVETREEFSSAPTFSALSSSTTTRKSRRLLERDGSRTTVDDVIEDVVRGGAAVVTRAAAAAAAAGISSTPRRSTRQNSSSRATLTIVEPRKSPRSSRRQNRRTSESSHDESADEKKKSDEENIQKISELATKETKPSSETHNVPAINVDSKPVVNPSPINVSSQQKPQMENAEQEPMTLIDPVTGLLIPMRESEEGQYIPVTTSSVNIATTVSITKPNQQSIDVSDSSKEADSIVKSKSLSPPTSKIPVSRAPIVETAWPSVAPHVPVISTSNQIALAPVRPLIVTKGNIAPNVKPSPVQVTVASPMPKAVKALQAHVLQHAVVTKAPPLAVLQQPTQPHQPLIKTVSSPQLPLNKPRDICNQSQPAKPVTTSVPINPKAHLLQAVASSKAVSATTVSSVIPIKGHHLGPPQTPPAGHSPTSMKSHLLQATKAGPPFGLPVKGPKGSPPLAHQPILTGAVASPPLKVPHHSQQPVVTGASSSRIGVPKSALSNIPGVHLTAHPKMDPPKVEVSMGGCIVVPTASPRGQVMQAGLPVPAYEASLHAGSAGVVAELLPNPQFVVTQRQTPPPAHQHGSQGDVQHVSFPHHIRGPPHDMPPPYVHPQIMYQQYLRAQQEALGGHIPYHLPPGAVRSPLLPGMDVNAEPEGEEASRGVSPPLELRAAHGALPSPHDRTTDSPQIATVYRLASRFYDEPPLAHLRHPTRHLSHPIPGTEAPTGQPRLQVTTPPHASQVPPQADSLLMLLQRYPVMWQGLLALKNDQAAVQMHFVFGNPHLARDSLPSNCDGTTPPLRIAQRMRLEQTQLEGVARKMQIDNEHCMLLALPCGVDHMDVLKQSNNLQSGFITYLQQKQAAGIVNVAGPGSTQAAYVVHIFPSCEFANENLARIAPDLLHRVADIAHLLIIIATV